MCWHMWDIGHSLGGGTKCVGVWGTLVILWQGELNVLVVGGILNTEVKGRDSVGVESFRKQEHLKVEPGRPHLSQGIALTRLASYSAKPKTNDVQGLWGNGVNIPFPRLQPPPWWKRAFRECNLDARRSLRPGWRGVQ